MSNEEILAEALPRLKLAEDAEIDIRRKAADDLYFLYISMWDDQDRKNRQSMGQNRPCLEFNLLLGKIKKLTNEARLNKPNVKVSPEDDNADIETAIKIGGLIKQILKNANFDTAISSAFENAVESSFGYVRVLTKFINEESFDQDIDVDYIDNPFSVYIDNQAKLITKADAEWGFITDDVPKKQFIKDYPDATITSMTTSSIGDSMVNWMTEDTVRIAEYYTLEKVADVLIEGIDAEGVIVKGLKSELEGVDSLVITRQRDTFRKKWMWHKITGADVLESKELAGPDFPIVAVLGRRKNINNKEELFSLIRFSKDANRMYNYWRSSEAEQLSATQKTPYIGAKGQFKDDMGWKNANVNPRPYLEYTPVSIGGQIAPPPMRAPAPEAPIGYIQAAQTSKEDLAETMGLSPMMQNNNVGANKSQVTPNALSGVALDNLNQSGEMSTYDFIDNMNKSCRQIFRIINNLIPKIYDTERVERILGEDDKEELVTFNGAANEDGEIFDVTVGRYDIDIDVGPDYATRRKQTADSMMDFIRNVPEAGAITGDLVAESQDWKNSDKFAARLKKAVPPELLGDDEKDEEQVAQELAQAQQELQSVTAQLDQALELINTRQIDQEIAANKEQGALQREMIKSETTLEKQRIDTEGELKEETIKAQSDIITTLIANQQELTDQLNGLDNFVKNGNSQSPLDARV